MFANFRAKNKQWFNLTAKSNDVHELEIYDAIDSYWGVSALDLVNQLKGVKAKQIVVRLNSPGGSVFDGMAIYNALRRHEASIKTVVDGLAASIASIIMLAGDEIEIGTGGMVMIHNAWGVSLGNASEMRKTADTLDKIDNQLVAMYSARMGVPEDQVRDMLAAETWFTADEAVAAKLVDRKAEDSAPKAYAHFDLSGFRNAPKPSAEDQDKTENPAEPEDVSLPAEDERVLRARLRLLIAENA